MCVFGLAERHVERGIEIEGEMEGTSFERGNRHWCVFVPLAAGAALMRLVQ